MDTNDLVKKIAYNIRKFRETNKMTREQFCEKLNIDAAYWGTIERGERNINIQKVIEICKTYNIDTSSIIELDTVKEDNSENIKKVHDLIENCTNHQLSVIINILEVLIPNLKK
ncbi:MAG: helix-turn-helix domain-containing protein [Clostridia bacterium]|jgi:transcriptional regulator with XRE-family HTH domain|nr:helix-turn-helix transcriptional regulator [Clostridiaceae bacterium]